MTQYDCCVVGAGSFGTALATYLNDTYDVIATHHDASRLQGLETATTTDNAHASQASRITCVTVRPDQINQALDEIQSWSTLLNFTPKLINEPNTVQAACSPPVNNALHYFAYDDTHAAAEDKARVQSTFKPITATFTETTDHAEDLADMGQVYAHVLTYVDAASLSEEKTTAFLDLARDTVTASPDLKSLLTAAATKHGFTAAALQHSQLVRDVQRQEQRSIDEVYNEQRP